MTATLNKQQQDCLNKLANTHHNYFITGQAGTGKSLLLKKYARNHAGNLAICAPTGVAALNVGGQTLHSLLRLPLGLIADTPLHQNSEHKKLLQKLDTLVIDEISMVSADLMDGIDRALRTARSKNSDKPFGGVQLILFGDPYQLPPIPPRSSEEKQYYTDNYLSQWFFDAHVWQHSTLETIELHEIHRQTDNEFRDILTALRDGTITNRQAEQLNTAANKTPQTHTLTLATINRKVDSINTARLKELPGKTHTYKAEIEGEFNEREHPTDENLHLKLGAQVMLLKNDPDGRYVNGTIGTVTKLATKVTVEIDGKDCEIEASTWQRYRYSYDPQEKRVERETVGEFKQIPLRLAWAITIHKAQGLTFDRVTVDLGYGAFSAGQAYVALSRVRTLEGLHLTRPLRQGDVQIDSRVRAYMNGSR